MGASGSNHNFSNVPVFHGKSQKLTINSQGLHDFNLTGLSMDLNTGTYPNGDVWVSRSYINPDVLPDSGNNFNSYTIINNYGTNQTFSPLKSISFTDNINYKSTTIPNFYNLYKRKSNGFGNTWGGVIDSGDIITGISGSSTKITFSTGLYLSSFSQFVLSNKDDFSTSIKDKENFQKGEKK